MGFSFYSLIVVQLLFGCSMNFPRDEMPHKTTMAFEILNDHSLLQSNRIIKYIWEKEPSKSCNIERPSESSLSDKTFIEFNFVPYLCVVLYDASLRYMRLNPHPNDSISLNFTQKLVTEPSTFCKKMQGNTWVSSIGGTKNWVSRFNEDIKNISLCQRYCVSDIVNPLCAYALWIDTSVKYAGNIRSLSDIKFKDTHDSMGMGMGIGLQNYAPSDQHKNVSRAQNKPIQHLPGTPASSIIANGESTNDKTPPIVYVPVVNNNDLTANSNQKKKQAKNENKVEMVETKVTPSMQKSSANVNPHPLVNNQPYENRVSSEITTEPQEPNVQEINSDKQSEVQGMKVKDSDKKFSLSTVPQGNNAAAIHPQLTDSNKKTENSPTDMLKSDFVATAKPLPSGNKNPDEEKINALGKKENEETGATKGETAGDSKTPALGQIEKSEPEDANQVNEGEGDVDIGLSEDNDDTEDPKTSDDGVTGSRGEGGIPENTNGGIEDDIANQPDLHTDDPGAGAEIDDDAHKPDDSTKLSYGRDQGAVTQNDPGVGFPHEHFVDAEESHFFAYFMTMIILCILGYLIFHNKQKILALALEGRARKGTRRRPSTSGYRKLDSNLEEAVTSSCTGSSVTHVIY